MNTKQIIALENLWKRLAKENSPTNITTYLIASWVQQGKLDAAKREYLRDGDKISDVYLPLVREILGCRLHQLHNCDNFFCQRFENKK